MKFSNLALNLYGPWMISPEWAAAMAPVLKGVLHGAMTEFDKAPEPYLVKCADLRAGTLMGTSHPDFTNKSIHVTFLTGTMMKHDSCEMPGTKTIGRELLEADRNPEVIGHIIVAESGGGAANAVPEMADAIRACTKPVVAHVDGVAASACLYAISYCDKILAKRESDIIGSVGTLIELSGYAKYAKSSDGFITARIYADAATDKNSDYEAALEGNFQVIKEERLNPLNDRFVADMKANRPAALDEQLTGKVYPAKAVVGTLIDGIGSMDDAIQAVLDLAAALEEQNSSTSQNMNNYPTLQAMPAFEGQVFEQDGSTTVQAVQLEAVEAALAEGASRQATIDGLQEQLTEAQNTVAAREARITELEASLEAAIARAENPNPEGVQVHHEGEGEQGAKPANTFEEALAACNDFNAKHNI